MWVINLRRERIHAQTNTIQSSTCNRILSQTSLHVLQDHDPLFVLGGAIITRIRHDNTVEICNLRRGGELTQIRRIAAPMPETSTVGMRAHPFGSLTSW